MCTPSAIRRRGGNKLPVEAALLYSVGLNDVAPAQLCLFSTNFFFGGSNAIFYSPRTAVYPRDRLPPLPRGRGNTAPARRSFFPRAARAPLVEPMPCAADHAPALRSIPLALQDVSPRRLFPDRLARVGRCLVDRIPPSVPTRGELCRRRLSNRRRIGQSRRVARLSRRNVLSRIRLPSSLSPLPVGMDPRLGRVVTFGGDLPEPVAYRYLSTPSRPTWLPQPRGYNPLVGRKELEYSFYLDYPNICSGPVTAESQKQFEARSVRY